MTAILTCVEHQPDLEALRLGRPVRDVLQNGGGVATRDVVASLRASQGLNGTAAVVVMHHTNCEFLPLTHELQRLVIAFQRDFDVKDPADVRLATKSVMDVLRQPDALAPGTTVLGAVWAARGRSYDWVA